MLTPEQLDDAGELVAETYRQIEAELLDHLVAKMADGGIEGQRAKTAIGLLSQSMPLELKRIIESHADEIDANVRDEVEGLLAKSDAFDIARIAQGVGIGVSAAALTAQTVAVASSARRMLARDNLELSAAARAKFLQWSTWASTQVATGSMTADKALHKAVRELAKGGLSIPSVTYRNEETGKVTVTNRVDVAVQRHLRSLIAQGAADLTMQRIRESGVEFVEVSSHIGSRPSHAEWHGRCYHVGGRVTVDGVTYEDFHEGTGYEGISGPYTALGDQLLGVNCRHSFAPWTPGSPRAYAPDPEHPSGLSNDEVYDLTQKQRARERAIRATKRELAAAQRLYDLDPIPENQVEVSRLKLKLRGQQKGMRDFIAESNARCKPGTSVLSRQPRREWASDMPKSGKITAMEHNESLVRMSKDKSGLSVSPNVNTKAYHDAFEKMPIPKAVAQSAYEQVGRILQKANGRDAEYLVAIDGRNGALIVDNMSRAGIPRKTWFNEQERQILEAHDGEVILIHNHPHSAAPSYGDVMIAAKSSSVTGSVIAGHDGSVWFISASSAKIADKLEGAYNTLKDALGDRAEIAAIDSLIKRGRKEGFIWKRLH